MKTKLGNIIKNNFIYIIMIIAIIAGAVVVALKGFEYSIENIDHQRLEVILDVPYNEDEMDDLIDSVISDKYILRTSSLFKTIVAIDSKEFTDEEIDEVADTAIAALQDILKYFDVGEVTIEEYEGDEGELILDITGEDLAILIGRHGRTLESLQFLISSITSRKLGFRYPVVVDVEGYKARQRQKIEGIAMSAADNAVSQQRKIKLRPMTPYERRIVHLALRDDSRVETASEGEGRARRVVIIPL